MVLRIIVLAAAQFLDFGTFVPMVSLYGPAAEANPIVAYLFVDFGLPVLALAKVALVAVVVAAVVSLSAVPGRQRHLGAFVLWSGIIAGIVGGWSNALVLIR
jgi:hypothetical protein